MYIYKTLFKNQYLVRQLGIKILHAGQAEKKREEQKGIKRWHAYYKKMHTQAT